MKKTLIVILTLMLPLTWTWAAGEKVMPQEQMLELQKAGIDPANEGVTINPVKEGNLLDSTNPIPEPPVITTNIITQDFEEAWSLDTPPTGWTIIDNGTEGQQCWYNQDWYKYYNSSWSDTVARFYYSPSMESTYNEWLITPDVVLPGAATACSLTFNTYYDDYSSTSNYDTAYVKVSTDGGSNWTTIITWGSDQGTSSTPASIYYDLTSYAGQTIKVAFNLQTFRQNYLSASQWQVDKVKVIADAATLLNEDFNNWGPWGDNPPSTWTILDNGIPYAAQGTWNNNDWYKYTAWSSGIARVYYTSSYYEWQDEWMISPAFAIGTGNACTLSVAEYYYHSTSTNTDHGYIKVSTDGGTTWPYTVADHNSTFGSSSTKNYYLYDLGAFAGESNLKLAFNFVNEPYGLGDYWYVDDVSVDEYVPPTQDPGVISVDAPPVLTYTGGNYTITATIENAAPDSTIIDSVLFVVDTGAVTLYSNTTYPGVYLQGNTSQQFSSSTQWNPTSDDWYTLTVTVYGSGDENPLNNSYSTVRVTQGVLGYPFEEDFEGGLVTSIYDWVGFGTGFGYTTSNYHSPDTAMWFNWSGYPNERIAVSPPIYVSGSSDPLFRFWEKSSGSSGPAGDETHMIALAVGDWDWANFDTLLWEDSSSTLINVYRETRIDAGTLEGDTVRVVFWYHNTTSAAWAWYVDDISLAETPTGDVGPTDFVSGTAAVVNQAYTPVVEVTNYGGDTPDVPVKLVIDSMGTTVYNQTVTITAIPAFGTANATFPNYTPLGSGAEVYTMTATTELVTVLLDNDPSNDTLIAGLAVYDALLDFEANDGGLEGSGDWQWGTPTTGPGSAYSGTKLWATNLTGNYTAGLHTLQFRMEVGTTVPTFGFASWYKTEGDGTAYDGCNFAISTDGGGTWTVISPDRGYDKVAGSSNPLYPDSVLCGTTHLFWQQLSFDLSAYAGSIVRARLALGADASVFYDGWYVDDFVFTDCALFFPSLDAELTSIDEPAGSVVEGSTVTPTVTVSNNGTDAAAVDVTFRILDDTQAVIYNQTETTASIPGGGSLQHAFATTWTASPGGSYTSVANVTLVGDTDPTNDTSTAAFEVLQHYSTGGPDDFGYRWIDNFNPGDEPAPVYDWIDISTIGTEITTWTGSVDDGYYRLAMNTTFNFYGVDYDSITVSTNGWLCFVAATSSYLSNAAIPNTALPNTIIAPLWDDQDGGAVGHCYYYLDTINNRFIVSWVNWPYYPDPTDPHNYQVILDANSDQVICQYGSGVYQTDITIGIENQGGTTGLQYYYEGNPPLNVPAESLAIKFYLPVYAHDVMVTDFVAPAASGLVNVPFTPEVTFENNGTNDETNVPVYLYIDPGGYADTQSIAVLDSGTSVSKQFAQFTPTATGSYTLTAVSNLSGDEDPASDTLVFTFTAWDAIFDFEANNGGLSATGDWQWGTPTSGPGSAYSGTKLWATNLAGNYTAGLHTLEFTLAVGAGSSSLGVASWYATEASWDGCNFAVSTDAGATWTEISPNVGYNGLGNSSNPLSGDSIFTGLNQMFWDPIIFDLSAYAGSQVKARFALGADGSVFYAGWYIDDLAFINCEIALGTIDGTVTDANTTSPVEGATVKANGIPVDVTDINGYYSFDIGPGDIVVEISKAGYITDTDTVTVVNGQTTTHNVALTAPIALIDTSPVVDTVAPGDTMLYSRYLYNTGTGALNYSVSLNLMAGAPMLMDIRSNSKAEAITNLIDSKVTAEGSADVAPFSYGGGNVPVITDFMDSIFVFYPESTTVDNGCLGVEFDGNYFWVTGRNSSGGEVHKLHKFDSNGNWIASYDQGTSSVWGWRDMAWDGTYLYASDENEFAKIDPATGAKVDTLQRPAGMSPLRALAYDPATDHFFSANFSSNIIEFDRTGSIINTWSNTKAIYGMAFDDLTEGGPYLWVNSQDGTPLMQISQFRLSDGTYTGVTWQSALPGATTDALAGGACFTTEWNQAIGALFVLGQGTPTDFVYGYEIAPNIVQWLQVASGGSGSVAPDDSAEIVFMVDFRDSTIVEDSTYDGAANINNNSAAPTPVIDFTITASSGGGCSYVTGDVNGSDSYNGLDITYGVAYFKGGPEPHCPLGSCPIPPCNTFFYCGDVNGTCSYNGLDITYGVAYFKGGPGPIPCPSCPPIGGPATIGNQLRPSTQPAKIENSKSKTEQQNSTKKGNSLNK